MALPGDAMKSVSTWTDLSGFQALRQSAQSDAKSALPVVARQFESIFTQMMLKSMRDASGGDGLFESQGGDAWRDMFDQQLSIELSRHGNGLGIAQMLMRQLGGSADTHGADQATLAAVNDDWRERLKSVTRAARAVGSEAVQWLPQDAQDFVRQLAPHAQKAAAKLGVSVRAVLAQAALETQWGQHMPAHGNGDSSNNLFGMKAGGSWGGQSVSVPTLEFEDGVAVRRRAQFRAYASPGESFDDYAQLIAGNPRYAKALHHGDDVLGFARGLVNGGYATDPSYAEKLAAIANSPAMREALDALKKVVRTPNSSE
ncbi:flagellar assembly peptidoglycan hydrolase FlgJ [Dyella soli]|uniref:Peptidoglycan hydrolase FlgJ n=1 Tax=Dyella soli TaxID=522319 RepID=A0A4R0YL38_9GAMM|nr:flagellar assembly peptidoglycan hydrolase FlgJ [Dyella soli]TCI06800.1 flagellar assembly peptidoglycan hydrolase FlgJ [Dyella soli]